MAKTEKRERGDLGEKLATAFLEKRGFSIVQTNYLKKWGEIDIIVRKGKNLHFVEVKTVTRTLEFRPDLRQKIMSSAATALGLEHLTYSLREFSGNNEDYRPEDNLHPWKLQRLRRTIQSYLAEKRMSEEDDWQFDAVTVRLDEEKKIAEVEIIDDIIL